MTTLTNRAAFCTTPAQVWAHLTAECQRQAIRCLAQLAVNWTAAHVRPDISEVPHEDLDATGQTPR